MNSRNAMFLSAALTAFVVAVLFGVVAKVTAANRQAEAAAPVAVQAPAASVQPQPDVPADPAVQPALGPEEAATLAAKAINRQDVYSVESFKYMGTDSFKVVFSSGDVVYMGLDRSVLARENPQMAVASITAAQAPVTTIINTTNASQPQVSRRSGSRSSHDSSNGTEHETESESDH
ncbi:MAG TPA: hypothetical protein VGK00_02680 [Anaerolineales bacterium]|jgi:hypothetical protein